MNISTNYYKYRGLKEKIYIYNLLVGLKGEQKTKLPYIR